MTKVSALHDKAETANAQAYAWAVITYPHMVIPFLPIQPNGRLKRAIARIYTYPESQQHIEYTPQYFQATKLNYCVKVLKHEYTHLVCYLKDQHHFQDGDPIFERELAQHKLESNYNSNNRDVDAMMAIQQVINNRKTQSNRQRQAQQAHQEVILADKLRVGQGFAIVCAYCGKVFRYWKKPAAKTLFTQVANFSCHHCHYGSSLSCYLIQIVSPTTPLILQRWVQHQSITPEQRQSFVIMEVMLDPAAAIRIITSRAITPDIANYSVLNTSINGHDKAVSLTRLPNESGYRTVTYRAGHGWN